MYGHARRKLCTFNDAVGLAPRSAGSDENAAAGLLSALGVACVSASISFLLKAPGADEDPDAAADAGLDPVAAAADGPADSSNLKVLVGSPDAGTLGSRGCPPTLTRPAPSGIVRAMAHLQSTPLV